MGKALRLTAPIRCLSVPPSRLRIPQRQRQLSPPIRTPTKSPAISAPAGAVLDRAAVRNRLRIALAKAVARQISRRARLRLPRERLRRRAQQRRLPVAAIRTVPAGIAFREAVALTIPVRVRQGTAANPRRATAGLPVSPSVTTRRQLPAAMSEVATKAATTGIASLRQVSSGNPLRAQ